MVWQSWDIIGPAPVFPPPGLRGDCHLEVIILHLGENDLIQTKDVAFVVQAFKDLRKIKENCPEVLVVLKKYLQRHIWRGAFKPTAIEIQDIMPT